MGLDKAPPPAQAWRGHGQGLRIRQEETNMKALIYRRSTREIVAEVYGEQKDVEEYYNNNYPRFNYAITNDFPFARHDLKNTGQQKHVKVRPSGSVVVH